MTHKPYPDRTREAVAERREQVRRLTLFGYSAREIAQELGIDRINVIRHRKALGIAMTPAKHLTDEQVEQARLLIEDGASIAEVARTVGCSHWAIKHRWPDAAWTHEQRTDLVGMLARLDPDRSAQRRNWYGIPQERKTA